MPTPQQGRRGSYAKGVAKREEILERALEVIAREGYRGASVKELADAVGLSQAGLLHYFDSKEELFAEILRKRDELDVVHFGPGTLDPALLPDVRDGYLGIIRHNSEVPGLVQLFSRMSVDAADPEHPAHQFFLDRGASLREVFIGAIGREQADGRITDRIDPETLARVFQAVADGMQVQWMLDPSVDMAATIDALFEALSPRRKDDA
ncbi:TetR/AcrR family transcriptional regulator [Microbacterium aoyamense]|uniref:TetR/AcrR family transcriptional regulator n=1 Tax=Microbacterium aoyamense TaxID=344166 RepID=A0ABP5AXE0_9MICO|nr:TetR/AcrR family transcriptional regulator [Microbacterium aoyamense]